MQLGSEQLGTTSHPRILLMAAESAPAPGWVRRCIAEVEGPAGELESAELKLRIKALVPEYQPHLD